MRSIGRAHPGTASRTAHPGTARPGTARLGTAAGNGSRALNLLQTRNRRVLLLTASLAATAVVTAVAAQAIGPRATAGAGILPVFVLALTAAEYLLVRFRVRDEIVALNLFEAVLAPMVIVLPAPAVVIAVAVSQAAAGILRRNSPVKTSFNVAQWSAAAAGSTLVVATLRAPAVLEPGTIVALIAAMIALSAINALSFAGVLRIVQDQPVRRTIAGVARTYLLTFAINVAFGVLFLAAYLQHPATITTFFVPLVFLHFGFRGYAGVLADRRRLSGLHRATEALATPMNPRDALPTFLNEVRSCFEADRVDLVLVEPNEIHRAGAQPGGYWTAPIQEGSLAASLLLQGSDVYLSAAGHDTPLHALLRADGHRDCLAAPLLAGTRLLGMLCVYDRTGLEGSIDGERAVLDALARAAAGALQKASLLEEILEEQQKLGDIVAYASDGILTAAPDGTVLTWNPAFETVTGFRASEMTGSRSLAALRPRTEDGDDVWLEHWADQPELLPQNLLVTTPDGEIRSLGCSYTVVPAPDGSPSLLIMVARDTTKVREIERLREDFVAAVSHELRTPLTPIKGFAATLLERGDQMDSAARESAVRSIARQAERLERLITNLLEMTKVERGMLAPPRGTGDAAASVAKVTAEVRAMNPDRIICLTLPAEGAIIRGDTLWVEQIVGNLLSNALKYSPATESVEVSVVARGDHVLIAVADNGAGIPHAQRERVFERFRRLTDDVTRATGGAGIGLYISRHLARMMEGDLVVAPSATGSTLLLTLPNARRLAAVG